MTTATFHVYMMKAYRSEIALFRAEGVTAINAEQVEAPVNAREFWRFEGPGALKFFSNSSEAYGAMLDVLKMAPGEREARLYTVSVID